MSKKEESLVQAKLSEKMMESFDWVRGDREKFYRENPNEKPGVDDVDRLIRDASNINAAISGGAGLIPGPFGMAVAIPEIALIIRNQLALIYDIGVAYGKDESVLTKELLAGVFASGAGAVGVGLLTMHGSKILVKRVSLRVLQKVINLLAGKVTQQVLKSMIAKWLPLVGAVAMAAWSKYTTVAVGKAAKKILSKDIEFETEDPLTVEDTVNSKPMPDGLVSNDAVKILGLINLMKVDGKVLDCEMEFIEECIKKSKLQNNEASILIDKMSSGEKDNVDYTIFKDDPDESLGLIIDMVALAWRDNELHISEKIYIKQVGKILGIDESDINEMLTQQCNNSLAVS